MNREMAAGYHASALELFLVAGCGADAAGDPLSDGYWNTVGAMTDALAATVGTVLSNARRRRCTPPNSTARTGRCSAARCGSNG